MAHKLTPRTAEQMVALRARGAEVRAQKKAERAASPLRQDFKDEPRWVEMAKERGLTLPPWGDPPTPKLMAAWLRKCGVTQKEYLDWFGEGTMASFQRQNPRWPLRAFAGIILECLDNGQILATSTRPRQNA